MAERLTRRGWTIALAFLFATAADAQDIAGADLLGGGEVSGGTAFTHGEVTITPARGAGRRPVVIFIANGDWPNEAVCETGTLFANLARAGVAVAEMWTSGRTLMLDVRSLQRGLRSIRRRAATYRLDLNQIAIVGCGTGRHFAALLGVDPSPYAGAELSFDAVRAVAIIDGRGFDNLSGEPTGPLAANASEQRRMRTYRGDTPGTNEMASPLAHLAAPNAPSFFFLDPTAGNGEPPAGARFAQALGAAGGSEIVTEVLPPPPAVATGTGFTRRQETIVAILAAFLISRLGVASQP